MLAITDHDTVAGHAEAIAAGEALGVRIVARHRSQRTLSDEGKEVHVLGYGVQPDDEATRTRIECLRDVREARAKALLSKLSALGIAITFERVQSLCRRWHDWPTACGAGDGGGRRGAQFESGL